MRWVVIVALCLAINRIKPRRFCRRFSRISLISSFLMWLGVRGASGVSCARLGHGVSDQRNWSTVAGWLVGISAYGGGEDTVLRIGGDPKGSALLGGLSLSYSRSFGSGDGERGTCPSVGSGFKCERQGCSNGSGGNCNPPANSVKS